jgi:RNA polymerase sigma-70 factor (ECF subfamily)
MESDREIVERVLAGERDAFAALVRQHQRLVAHVVHRMVRDPRDREELCQDVFFRVYRKLDTFAHQARLSTWIARIAYRACLNHLERRDLPLYDDLHDAGEGGEPAIDRVAGSGPSPLDSAEAEEMRAFVRARVDELPVQYRTVVTLYHLEEMSVGEIVEVTELPDGTVKSHLFRARKLLKEKLMAAYGPSSGAT